MYCWPCGGPHTLGRSPASILADGPERHHQLALITTRTESALPRKDSQPRNVLERRRLRWLKGIRAGRRWLI